MALRPSATRPIYVNAAAAELAAAERFALLRTETDVCSCGSPSLCPSVRHNGFEA